MIFFTHIVLPTLSGKLFPIPKLWWVLAVLLAAGLPGAHAQAIKAGQKTGVLYTDFIPDKTLDSLNRMSLDLDNDGRADFMISAWKGYMYPVGSSYASLVPLHADAGVMASYKDHPSYNEYPTYAFADGEYIQEAPPARSASVDYNYWVTSTSTHSDSYFTYRESNPVWAANYGSWQDGKKHYVGIRLRTTGGSWRYGWLNVDLTNGITVYEYALASILLAVQPAQASCWQVYPTYVVDHLTIDSPTTATTGHLLVRDLYGRTDLAITLTGSKQQLDLSALATGIYVLQLETAAGNFSQRIIKR